MLTALRCNTPLDMEQAQPSTPPFPISLVRFKTLFGTKLGAQKGVSDEAEFAAALRAPFHDNALVKTFVRERRPFAMPFAFRQALINISLTMLARVDPAWRDRRDRRPRGADKYHALQVTLVAESSERLIAGHAGCGIWLGGLLTGPTSRPCRRA